MLRYLFIRLRGDHSKNHYGRCAFQHGMIIHSPYAAREQVPSLLSFIKVCECSSGCFWGNSGRCTISMGELCTSDMQHMGRCCLCCHRSAPVALHQSACVKCRLLLGHQWGVCCSAWRRLAHTGPAKWLGAASWPQLWPLLSLHSCIPSEHHHLTCILLLANVQSHNKQCHNLPPCTAAPLLRSIILVSYV